MPVLTPQERVGTVLAQRYLLEALLARGGMGLLYSGQHLLTGRRVAVKVLPHEEAHGAKAERFLREARIATDLEHPHVVQVLDMGVGEDALFFVMELLEGESLGQHLARERRLTVERTLDWMLPVMGALSIAHARGVLHRDVKPANIFLARRAARTVPTLLDFGIAKTGQDCGTLTGVSLGTPLYMSPEQARGERDLGPATDVWSVGMVLYHCLTGIQPFRAANPTGVLGRVLTEAPTPLAEVDPTLPATLAACVDRALRRPPTERPSGMEQFASELLAASGRDPAPLRELFAAPLPNLAAPAAPARPVRPVATPAEGTASAPPHASTSRETTRPDAALASRRSSGWQAPFGWPSGRRLTTIGVLALVAALALWQGLRDRPTSAVVVEDRQAAPGDEVATVQKVVAPPAARASMDATAAPVVEPLAPATPPVAEAPTSGAPEPGLDASSAAHATRAQTPGSHGNRRRANASNRPAAPRPRPAPVTQPLPTRDSLLRVRREYRPE